MGRESLLNARDLTVVWERKSPLTGYVVSFSDGDDERLGRRWFEQMWDAINYARDGLVFDPRRKAA